MPSIHYDPDKVIRMCEGKGSYIVDYLVNDINKLISELDNCQRKFHAKGYQSNNAINKIYKGFSNIIGYSRGDYYGNGLGGLVSNSAKIINTAYAEALEDKRILEWEKAEEERKRREEEERRRREEEERRRQEEQQRIGSKTFRY